MHPDHQVSMYLERSKGCPLDVTIDYEEHNRNDLIAHAGALSKLDILLRHSCLWWRLIFICGDRYLNEDMMSHLHHLSIPRLLQLHLIGPQGYPLGSPPLKFIHRLTSLTTLELHFLSYSVPLTLDEFQSLLATSPLLRNLTLLGEVINFPLTPFSTVELPSLSSLALGRFPSESYAASILRILSAPSLDSLWIWDVEADALQRSFSANISLLHKLPLLRSLTLWDLHNHEIDWMPMAFPHLTYLTIHGCFCVERYLAVLSSTSTDGRVIWPTLETLSIGTDYPGHGPIKNMISFRYGNGCPLPKLRLERSHFHSTKLWPKELRESTQVQAVRYQGRWDTFFHPIHERNEDDDLILLTDDT
jgi:hypothetical protein